MNQFTNSAFTAAPFEIPGAFREFAEKGVTQARQAYDRFKEVADETNGALEAVCDTATKGVSTYNAKMLEIAKANTNAMFELAHELVGARNMAEMAELFSAHSRKHVETLTAQTKELTELGQKFATDTVEPLKATTNKVFQKAA